MEHLHQRVVRMVSAGISKYWNDFEEVSRLLYYVVYLEWKREFSRAFLLAVE